MRTLIISVFLCASETSLDLERQIKAMEMRCYCDRAEKVLFALIILRGTIILDRDNDKQVVQYPRIY